MAADVIRRFADGGWSERACLNINFPDRDMGEVGPVELTTQGAGLLSDIEVISGRDPRDLPFHWLNLCRSMETPTLDSETNALNEGRISVTPLQFERTNRDVLETLRNKG